METFVVQFPVKTRKFQEDILDKQFEIGRKIYNSLVTVTQKRYKEMIKTKGYCALQSSFTGNKEFDEDIWMQLNEIHKQYGMSEYSFCEDVRSMQKHFSNNIDSFTAQKVAAKLWKAYDDFFYGSGKPIQYKKYGTFNSLEANIQFANNTILWNGLKLPVVIDYNNYHECEALKCDIVYCKLIRKCVRSKYKYYAQIVFTGNPPLKADSFGN
jgi:hypothetical protein